MEKSIEVKTSSPPINNNMGGFGSFIENMGKD
jgi:hypothetical protein